MILSDIKRYLQERRQAALGDLLMLKYMLHKFMMEWPSSQLSNPEFLRNAFDCWSQRHIP
jgi:hypothetical protein